MKEFSFGRFRHIEVVESGAEAKDIDVNFVLRLKDFSGFKSDDIKIVGSIDGHLPMIAAKNNPAIYSFIPENKTLLTVKVADNRANLVQLLELIQIVWGDDRQKISLEKNEATLALYHETIEEIKKNNPGSDVTFWDEYAFLDLKLGLY